MIEPEPLGGCPTCGAAPEFIKERENGPDGKWGSHVCTACGCELYGGDMAERKSEQREKIRDELPDEVYAAEAEWVRIAMKAMTARRMVGWLNAYAEYETTAGNDTTAEHVRNMATRLQAEVEPDESE